MYLEGQHVDSGWIRSTFTLTHRVSWQQMLQAIYAAFDYFTEIVIFVDEKSQRIKSREDVLTIPESSSIAIAGISTVFKVPMSIFFYTQVQFSNVRLKCVSEELYGLDYERYNKMVCPLMNALELAMFRKPAKPSRGHKGSKGRGAAKQTSPPTRPLRPWPQKSRTPGSKPKRVLSPTQERTRTATGAAPRPSIPQRTGPHSLRTALRLPRVPCPQSFLPLFNPSLLPGSRPWFPQSRCRQDESGRDRRFLT